MDILATQVQPDTPAFRENRAAMEALVAELRERREGVRQGGGEAARARHAARGKLLVRERVERLLDPGTPFLELSPLAAWGNYDDEVPAAGLITGIGVVHGQE